MKAFLIFVIIVLILIITGLFYMGIKLENDRRDFCESQELTYHLEFSNSKCFKVSGNKIVESFKIIEVGGERYLKALT